MEKRAFLKRMLFSPYPLSAGVKKEPQHFISFVVLGPSWQSQAQSSTQQVTVSVPAHLLCLASLHGIGRIHGSSESCTSGRQAGDGAHGVSVHTGVQTWARSSYLTSTLCCVCLVL